MHNPERDILQKLATRDIVAEVEARQGDLDRVLGQTEFTILELLIIAVKQVCDLTSRR
jgi:hypothetical protein